MSPERASVRNHRAPRRKAGFPWLVEAIRRQREAAPNSDALDRRALLKRLCAELETEEAQLLRRGFDRAYRQVIEGV
jgi:hypothetical protein